VVARVLLLPCQISILDVILCRYLEGVLLSDFDRFRSHRDDLVVCIFCDFINLMQVVFLCG
jgi:hypothetical protein